VTASARLKIRGANFLNLLYWGVDSTARHAHNIVSIAQNEASMLSQSCAFEMKRLSGRIK